MVWLMVSLFFLSGLLLPPPPSEGERLPRPLLSAASPLLLLPLRSSLSLPRLEDLLAGEGEEYSAWPGDEPW